MKKINFFFLGILLISLPLFSLCVENKPGGVCSYKKFPGSCSIIKVQHSDVYFSFTPNPGVSVDRPTQDELVNKTFIEYSMYLGLKCLRGGYDPEPDDLEKCNIKAGSVFDCDLHLETAGMCSPVTFSFADQSGYKVATCNEKCIKKGHESSYCSVSKIPSEYRCDAEGYRLDELSSDCMGAGTACCCKGTTTQCAKEGETINTPSSTDRAGPTTCCAGLTPDDGYTKPDAQGNCPKPLPRQLPVKETCIKCGDGTCGIGENYCNCPKDCPGSETGCIGAGGKLRSNGEENGKRCCEGLTEVFDQWELDSEGNCLALDNYGYHCLKCGDGACGKGENKCNCPQDCKGAAGPECQDSSDCVVAVNLGGCCACPRVLPRTSLDSSKFVVYESGKDYSSMLPAECKNAVCSPCGPVGSAICQSGKCVNVPVCGNSYCERGEESKNCPQDCGTGAVCGNGFCEAGENRTSCAQDCVEKRIVCGDNYCTTGENESNCPVDCGPHRPVCGNGFCEKPSGENATNCAPDCEINSVCGNLACEEDEDKITCPLDCADHT